jgi:Xaa-Pro dipeptidase
MPAADDDLANLYRAHLAHLDAATGAALARLGYDALVIAAGPTRAKSPFDDQDWPFRPTPAFAHWLPLREAGAALVVRPGQRPRLLRTAEAGYWDGPAPALPGFVAAGFDTRAVAADAIAAERPAGKVAFVGDVAADAAAWGLPVDAINPPALIDALHAIRARKTAYEQRCVAEANAIACRGHRRAFAAFEGGRPSELELHHVYLGATAQDDAETPYKGIVALGAHAGVLHHVHYGRTPGADDQSLLIDAGATYHGYCSDVTRTAVKGASAGATLFRALIARIDELQRAICARVRPGLAYEALHDQAHELLAPVLRELGLVDASDDELVASGATRIFLPHGLGHGLGIQVHDVGQKPTPPRADNPYLRNTSAIEVDQLFTIEPGCYFIPTLLDELRARPIGARVRWSTIDALRPYGGVRIEDDVVVETGGARNLTRPAWDGAG